jgi:hypothetical protein
MDILNIGNSHANYNFAERHLEDTLKCINISPQSIVVSNYNNQDVSKNYISKEKKVFLPGDVPYGHLILEVLGAAIYEIDTSPGKIHFVFSAGPGSDSVKENGTGTLLKFFSRKLKNLGHDVTFVHQSGQVNTLAVANNFVVHCKSITSCSYTLKRIRDVFLSEIEQKPPTKKIYLSRGKVFLNTTVGDRASREEILEDYMRTLGFIVVYPEDFETYEQQLEVIASARVVASVTSSALLSSIFMSPGSTVVEFAVELFHQDAISSDIKPIYYGMAPTHYYQVSGSFNLNYVAINNDGNSVNLVDTIESNIGLKSLLLA